MPIKIIAANIPSDKILDVCYDEQQKKMVIHFNTKSPAYGKFFLKDMFESYIPQAKG